MRINVRLNDENITWASYSPNLINVCIVTLSKMYTASDTDDCCAVWVTSRWSLMRNKSAADSEAWWCCVSTLPLNRPSVWWFIPVLHIIDGHIIYTMWVFFFFFLKFILLCHLTRPPESLVFKESPSHLESWHFFYICLSAGCLSATPQPLRPFAASQPHCPCEQNPRRWAGGGAQRIYQIMCFEFFPFSGLQNATYNSQGPQKPASWLYSQAVWSKSESRWTKLSV